MTTTSGMHLLPEYDSAFNLSVDPVRAYFKEKDNLVEPVDYPTDKDVTDEEQAAGIRAWREVPDPDGSGRVGYLPIYRTDYFSPEEQNKIPKTGSDEHPELYVDHFGGTYLAAVAWTELDETPALWGEPGTGKTELYRYLAWLMNLPFERMSITASTEIDELIGMMKFHPEKGTFFKYGRLPLAWMKPGVLCIDEPNVGPLEVWQKLRPLTDNSKQMVLDENENELIDRHVDCFLGFAMNPAWDPRNIGANQIASADADRLFHVFIDLPPASLEREIIANRVRLDGWEISNDQLDMMMNIAQDVRDLSKDGTLTISWALRPQIKVARALRWFDTVTAYRRAIGDFLEPRQLEALLDMVKTHTN
jgi:MoxR-like ATPase